MVRMDHSVLNSHVISTKDEDLVTSWMIKAGNVVDKSINADFRGLETFQRAQTVLDVSIGMLSLVFLFESPALAQLVRVGSHD